MLVFSQFQEGQNREFTKSFLESNANGFFLLQTLSGNFSDSEKKRNSFFKKFKNGFIYLVKAPVKVSSGTVGVLEKVNLEKFSILNFPRSEMVFVKLLTLCLQRHTKLKKRIKLKKQLKILPKESTLEQSPLSLKLLGPWLD